MKKCKLTDHIIGWGGDCYLCGRCGLIFQSLSKFKCHCGKNGHALNSINCPIHAYKIVSTPLSSSEGLTEK